MRHGNEPIVVVAVFVHEEEADVLQTEIPVIDLFGHDPVRLRRTDRHDERDDLISFGGFLKFPYHLLRKKFIDFVQSFQHLELSGRLLHELLHGQAQNSSHFLGSFHDCILSRRMRG